MTQYSIITKDINQANKYIKEGRVVAFPTGTSYGLAVDVLQGHALQRLRNLKGRPPVARLVPAEKPFTVFMADQLLPKFLELSDREVKLIKKFSGRALTLLVKPKEEIGHLAGSDGLVGLRMIDHPLMKKLAENYDAPLTATSANYSGGQPCFSPDCVVKTFPGLLPDDRLGEEDPHGASGTTYDLSLACVLDGGVLPENPPTTIVRLVGKKDFEIVRPGAVSAAELKKLSQ